MRPFLACAILALVVSMATAKPLNDDKALRSLLKAISEKRLSFASGGGSGGGGEFKPDGTHGSGGMGSGGMGSGGMGSGGMGTGGFFPGGGPLAGVVDLLHEVLFQISEIKAALGVEPDMGTGDRVKAFKKGFGSMGGGRPGGSGGPGGAMGKPEKPEGSGNSIDFIRPGSGSGGGLPFPDGFKPPFGSGSGGGLPFPDGFKPPFGSGSGDHGSGEHGFGIHSHSKEDGSGGPGGPVRELLGSFSEKDLKDLVRALEELKRK